MKIKNSVQVKNHQTDFISGNKPVFLILLVAFTLYLPTLWYGFSPIDEHMLILNNVKSLGNINNIFKPFSTPILDLYYRPILLCSFMIDLIIGKTSPFTFHLTNVLLHAICSILVFKVFIQLNIGRQAAFWCAILFAVHPINVHTVAWIPGRNDSLLCLFSLLSISALLNYFKNNKYHFLVLHLGSLLLALFTKENAVLLPILFATIGLVVIRTPINKQFIVLSLAWVLIATCWFFLRKSIINVFPVSTNAHLTDTLRDFVLAIIIFIGKSIVPIQQAVMPLLEYTSIIPGVIIITLFVFLIVKFGVKDKRIAILGIIWFFLFIIIPTWFGARNSYGEHYEHRLYTSLIGTLLFASQIDFKLNRKIATVLLILLSATFAVKTIYRYRVYTDEFSFTFAGTSESPSIYILHSLEGDEYMNRKDFRKAVASYTKAIELKPGKGQLYFRRAQCYSKLKEFQVALENYNQAFKLFDNDKRYQNEFINYYSEACFGRSVVYFNLGQYNSAMNDLQQAKQLQFKGIPPNYFNKLNKALQHENIALYSDKIKKYPDRVINYYMRGIAYFNLGDLRRALPDINKAISLNPSDLQSIYARYQIYSVLGDKESASRDQQLLINLGFKNSEVDGKENK